MKKLFTIFLMTAAFAASAQNKKYMETMEKNVAALDTTYKTEQFQPLANTFERIAGAEKSEWLPNYYAAYCNVNMSYNTKGDMIDTYCDKADKYLHIADSLSPNNSEIYTLMAQVASARISVNPMSRGQKYGTMAAELRDKAKELDKTNPRPYYLEGTSFFFTPPMFGGGKDKAKPVFQKALEMYNAFKPVSSIAPRWGKSSTEYFLKKCDEK
ncbi:MAG: tetratricopeptide repeat protein [Bacteroidia bacterium]